MRYITVLNTLLVTVALTGCSDDCNLGTVELEKVTFAKSLSDKFKAVDPTDKFYPDVKRICLAVTVKNRPKSGKLIARFFLKEEEILVIPYDLSEVNGKVFVSAGQNTYVGYTFTVKKPLPVSSEYRVEIYHDDKKLGTYPFSVIPPQTVPNNLTSSTLARGANAKFQPVKPTTEFKSPSTVFIVGHGNFNKNTKLIANWLVGGKLDEAGTRSVTIQENVRNVGFSFSFLPKGGWPIGEHEVILKLNDKEAARHKFTVK